MTVTDENVENGSLTLGQRLADGPLPLPETLRYATMLAEALRQIHDSGRTCGALLPSNIVVTTTGLELIVVPGESTTTTPYTAPEILQGQPPDARSDIFAFGAIVYEMVTGRRAFAGDDADALAASLTNSVPPPSGAPAVEHLVINCIAKDPNVRYQRILNVILELKLLTFAAPRAEGATHQQSVMAALRAETQAIEARVVALLQANERAIIDIKQTSGDAVRELRGRLSSAESRLVSTQERCTLLENLCQRIMGYVEQVQQDIEAIDGRVTGVKDGIDAMSEDATAQQERVSARLREFEQTLKSQKAAIASVVAGQAQTDVLVEGVVGEMELLHTIVVDRTEDLDWELQPV
jgi:eukaryotic-like serine/threonine-protein kinase